MQLFQVIQLNRDAVWTEWAGRVEWLMCRQITCECGLWRLVETNYSFQIHTNKTIWEVTYNQIDLDEYWNVDSLHVTYLPMMISKQHTASAKAALPYSATAAHTVKATVYSWKEVSTAGLLCHIQCIILLWRWKGRAWGWEYYSDRLWVEIIWTGCGT